MSKNLITPKVIPGQVFSRIGYVQQGNAGDSPEAVQTRYPSLIQIKSAVNPLFVKDPGRNSDFTNQAEAIFDAMPPVLRRHVKGRRVYTTSDIMLSFYAGNTCALVLANLKALREAYASGIKLYDPNKNWANLEVKVNAQITKFEKYKDSLPVSNWVKDLVKKIGFSPATSRRPAVLHTIEVLAQLQNDEDSELFLDWDDSYFQFGLDNNIVTNFDDNLQAFIDHINWAVTASDDVLQTCADILEVYPETHMPEITGKIDDYRGFQLLSRNAVYTYVDSSDGSKVWNYNGWLNDDGLSGKQFNISNTIADGGSTGNMFIPYESDDEGSLRLDTMIGMGCGTYNNNNDNNNNRLTATVQTAFAIIGALIVTPTTNYGCSGDFKITLMNDASGIDESENYAIITCKSAGLISSIQIEAFQPATDDTNESDIATVLTGLNEDSIEHCLSFSSQIHEAALFLADYMYYLGKIAEK